MTVVLRLRFKCHYHEQFVTVDGRFWANAAESEQGPLLGGTARSLSALGLGQVAGARVSGGDAAKSGEFPWVARLDLPKGKMCGGVLVSSNQVLTAAHCLEGFSSSDLLSDAEIILGTTDKKETSCASCEAYGIDSFSIHPGYKASGFDSDSSDKVTKDIALITLDGSTCIRPARISKGSPRPGAKGIVMGWGETEISSSSSNLQKTTLSVLDQRECSGMKPKEFFDPKSSICTGPDEDRPNLPNGVYTSACSGDSGGPFVDFKSDATIWGIVSYSIKTSPSGSCGDKRYTVLTDVDDSGDWLLSQLTKNGRCSGDRPPYVGGQRPTQNDNNNNGGPGSNRPGAGGGGGGKRPDRRNA